MQHSQPSPLKSEKNPLQKVEGEIVETLADFFQRGNASAPIRNLNYLLNEFVRSNSFPEFEKDYVQDVVFMTSFTIDIITKLYELFEQREKIELEEYLCKSYKAAETLC